MEKFRSKYGKELHVDFCRLAELGLREGKVNVYYACTTE